MMTYSSSMRMVCPGSVMGRHQNAGAANCRPRFHASGSGHRLDWTNLHPTLGRRSAVAAENIASFDIVKLTQNQFSSRLSEIVLRFFDTHLDSCICGVAKPATGTCAVADRVVL